MSGNQRVARTGQRRVLTTQTHLRKVADSRNAAQSSHLRHNRSRTNLLKTSLLARESSIHRNSFTSSHNEEEEEDFKSSEADEANIELLTRAKQTQTENVTIKQNYFDNDLHPKDGISRLNFVDSER
eukprot:Seg7844.1 transcript_id=Seg7844.1/GoldUCD/mRNA.D3Y31 product="hypothetical protein" protein_id=Seg7844.1/GoldUCD/D3Y31